MQSKPRVIVIVGPTAVGKTALSIMAAKELNGEVISGDSMQIYKGLDIGTAKVTQEEKQGIPHYLLDELEPGESFTAADFKIKGREAIEKILTKGKLPIIAGGTGLYIESLLFDLPLGRKASSDERVRKALEEEAAETGKLKMWKKLEMIDPEAAEAIHPNNVRRVIRALEVYQMTGKAFSSQKEEAKESPYDYLIIGLSSDREVLYQRINDRVDNMLQEGLLNEAHGLWEHVSSDAQAAKGIGYKELFPYFDKQQTLEESVEKIKQHSRNYAKRQLTWFRNRLPEIKWFDLLKKGDEKEKALQTMKRFLSSSHSRKEG